MGFNEACVDGETFRGLRLLAVDGTAVSIPRNPKSDSFAEQEMYAAMTMFNFTSRIARESVIRQLEEGIHAYRVNFKMAAALCREYFRTQDGDYEKLLEEIGRHTVPLRPDRQNKRNLKAKGFAGFTYRVSSWPGG